MPHYYDSPEPKVPTERLCLTDDRMVTCPVAGLENTIMGLRHELTHTWTRTEEQRVRLTCQREALKAAVLLVNQRLDVEMYQYCSTQLWVEKAEAKLHGMTATMQRWRGLAGQMTDERNRLMVEVERLRGVMAHCPFHSPACIVNAENDMEDALAGVVE